MTTIDKVLTSTRFRRAVAIGLRGEVTCFRFSSGHVITSPRHLPPLIRAWVLVAVALAPHALLARSIWFDAPAEHFTESSPLGNGRLGAMFFGGIDQTRVVLNETGMWSGSRQDADRPGASEALPEIRRLLLAGDNAAAERLVNQHFTCSGLGSNRGRSKSVPYGCYQVLGNLTMHFSHRMTGKPVTEYRRELDLADATLRTTYKQGGVAFGREAFVSKPADAVAIRLVADQPGMVSFSLALTRPERSESSTDQNSILLQGRLEDGRDGESGVRYAALARIEAQGGSVVAEGDALVVTGADSACVYVTAATDIETFAGRRADDPAAAARQDMAALSGKTFDRQRAAHVSDYRSYFDRVALNLRPASAPHAAESLPTPARLAAYASDPSDLEFAATYFDFGRFLLMSSSRSGGLPANLQGLWAEELQTPWGADWHSNVNVQMNYWMAETCNLSALHQPLFALIGSLREPGARTARCYYGARGWVGHVLVNPWGFTSPGESASWGSTVTCSAWLCQHLWDHYLFTLDRAFLAESYPTLRGAARFYADILIEEPTYGWLVTAPSNSPENAFLDTQGKALHTCMGPAMDQQLLRYLFSACIDASTILDRDREFRQELTHLRARLAPNQVGSDGRLLEWLSERPEADPRHRHVSHLWGLFPGHEITAETPGLAEAARLSLEGRGDDGTGWALANKACMWARLGDGDRALKLFNTLLRPVVQTGAARWSGGTYPNLFDAHPPFQIDGNLGAPASVVEMLVQSTLTNTPDQRPAEIRLLPALPMAWPDGWVRGLRCRGGFEVDLAWADGELSAATIRSDTGYPGRLRYRERTLPLVLNKGGAVQVDGELEAIDSAARQ